MSIEEEKIPVLVKNTLCHFDKDIKVILFGSKARGDDHSDSDWDFLILTKETPTFEIQDQIRELLYDIELEVDQVITSIIESQDHWDLLQASEFYKNVLIDGVEINELIPA